MLFGSLRPGLSSSSLRKIRLAGTMRMTATHSTRDPNTLSNYDKFRTTHTAIDFTVDFEKKLLAGHVTLTLESTPGAMATEIVLDSSHLDIKNVQAGQRELDWSVNPRIEPYGSSLKINLGQSLDKFDIKISVSTTETCTALQWLTPEQTSNRKDPYMFSQCQAIHARSIFPCQDTPDVKSTMDFRIRSPLPVVASGIRRELEKVRGSSDHVYIFEQIVPIPSYLFAIASGDIAGAPIGPRSEVWASPDQLKECQWELENDTEKFIQTAEKLVYPYLWGTYNALVLPPSFPYGGMENPQYTFLTPTTISADRQNVDVVAHELSHSWSGNLVSPASWEHFWLNEGWTTYLERRIQGALHGEAARDFSAIIGWKALQDAVANFGSDHEFTKLVVNLKGKDPDEAFSTVPYEKGFVLLDYLEKLVGREEWDRFIPHYFTTFKMKSLTSHEFKRNLLNFFLSSPSTHAKLNSQVDWETWFHSPGLPRKPAYDSTLADVCYALAEKWESLVHNNSNRVPTSTKAAVVFRPDASDIQGWTANQVVVFLERVMIFPRPLPAPQAEVLGRTYSLTTSRNVEVTSRYYQIALQAGNKKMVPDVEKLLGEVGRMKFVRPLYRGLMRVDREEARRCFVDRRGFYHPICRGLVERDLGLDKEERHI